MHSWYTPGALPVHFLVHFWCTLGAIPKVSRKGIASLPKGSLDFPFRNVWIAFSLTCKPERELHRFRKEASILRTETFGSPFRQFANPKGNCAASERKYRSSAQKRLDRLFANLQTRKGIAPLPKGSLDPPHRNVWIAFCKRHGQMIRLDRPIKLPYSSLKSGGGNHDQAAAESPPRRSQRRGR